MRADRALRRSLVASLLLLLAGVATATDVEQVIGVLEKRALTPLTPDARERLAAGPIDEVLLEIDPHARLFMANAYQTPGLETLPSGIGAELKPKEAHLELWPYQDGPADRAGVIGGSRLLGVDGVEVEGDPPAEVAKRLRGPEGTAVDLTLSEPGGKKHRFRLFRTDFQPLDVESHVEYDRQLLRIRRFRAGLTWPAVAAWLAQYQDQKPERPLVLDLRFSGGGDVFEALDVAGLFLESGREVVAFADRSGVGERFTNRRSGDTSKPLSIWIGPDTASAAEILAAILRYHGRAELRGSPSHGKCSIQTDVPLPEGAVLRFTEKRVLLPDGNTCDGHPLEPDRPLPSQPPRGE